MISRRERAREVCKLAQPFCTNKWSGNAPWRNTFARFTLYTPRKHNVNRQVANNSAPLRRHWFLRSIRESQSSLSSKFDSFHVRWLLLQTVPPISKSIEIDSSQPRERNYEERTIHSGAASSCKRESHAIGVNRKARYEQRLVDAPIKRMHSPDRPVNCTPWAIDQWKYRGTKWHTSLVRLDISVHMYTGCFRTVTWELTGRQSTWKRTKKSASCSEKFRKFTSQWRKVSVIKRNRYKEEIIQPYNSSKTTQMPSNRCSLQNSTGRMF